MHTEYKETMRQHKYLLFYDNVQFPRDLSSQGVILLDVDQCFGCCLAKSVSVRRKHVSQRAGPADHARSGWVLVLLLLVLVAPRA